MTVPISAIGVEGAVKYTDGESRLELLTRFRRACWLRLHDEFAGATLRFTFEVDRAAVIDDGRDCHLKLGRILSWYLGKMFALCHGERQFLAEKLDPVLTEVG